MDKDIQAELQRFINFYTFTNGVAPTKEQIDEQHRLIIDRMNAMGRSEYAGYSADKMNRLVNRLWDKDSIITINKLTDTQFEQIPLLRQVLTLTEILTDKKKIKLTAKGNLPVAVVRAVYEAGVPNDYIEKIAPKTLKEDDVESVQRTRIIVEEIMQIVSVEVGVMTLTEKGTALIADKQQLFDELMYSFCDQFNWSYFDDFESDEIAQLGSGFSLALVEQMGAKLIEGTVYAEKYFAALPMCTPKGMDNDDVLKKHALYCYEYRTFERFMMQFGLVEMRPAKGKKGITYKKTPLFDKMLSFKK